MFSKLRQLALDYGTVVALLLMCVILSILTLKDQPQKDESAAERFGKRIARRYDKGDLVLIVVGDSAEDRAFEARLRETLQAAQLKVETVVGAPSDARNKLVDLQASEAPLKMIAANYRTVSWLLFSDLATDFPRLKEVKVEAPPAYRWPTFLKASNLLNVANQIAVIAIIAVGMTIVIITGGIDLSVGSLIALSSVVAAYYIREYGGGYEANVTQLCIGSFLGILVCALIGAFSGAMVIGMDIPPFIVTLAMMMVAKGMAFIVADNESIPEVADRFTWLGREASFGLPNAVLLMLGTYFVAHVTLSRTVLGRHIYAVGDNQQAAWLSGIRVRRVLMFTYIVCGMLAGVGGIVVASTHKSGDPNYGVMYELYVIAAVVVGGTSLSGGRGTILGTLVGALIIGVINNGMNLLKIDAFVQNVILGLVILGSVMLDKLKGGPIK